MHPVGSALWERCATVTVQNFDIVLSICIKCGFVLVPNRKYRKSQDTQEEHFRVKYMEKHANTIGIRNVQKRQFRHLKMINYNHELAW